MLIYCLIFGMLILLSILGKAKMPRDLSMLVFFILNIILIGFVGLRGDIDPDYSNYLDIFKSSGAPFSIGAQVELGYYYLNQIVLTAGFPFQVVIFVIACLSVYFKISFFRQYSPNFGLSLLIYFSTLFFLFDFIAIRQAVTLAVFMISIPLIYQRRFWPYLILMLLAAQIHVSALLLIPGYFLFNRRLSEMSMYAIVIICAVINLLKIKIPLIDILLGIIPVPGGSADKVAIYLTENEYAFVSPKQIVLGLIFVYMRPRIKQNEKMVNVLVNLFVFGILFATLLNGLPQMSYRIKWYFFWTESVLVVYIVDYIAKKDLKVTYALYSILFVFYGYLLFTLLQEIASRGSFIFPYKFFFQ